MGSICRLHSTLAFINQNPAKTITVAFQNLRALLEQPDGEHDQITEIKGIAQLQPFLVGGKNPGNLFANRIVSRHVSPWASTVHPSLVRTVWLDPAAAAAQAANTRTRDNAMIVIMFFIYD